MLLSIAKNQSDVIISVDSYMYSYVIVLALFVVSADEAPVLAVCVTRPALQLLTQTLATHRRVICKSLSVIKQSRVTPHTAMQKFIYIFVEESHAVPVRDSRTFYKKCFLCLSLPLA